MVQILYVSSVQPSFPPTDQNALATRTKIGNVWVDAINGTPTQTDLDAYYAPSVAQQQRLATFLSDPSRQAILIQIQTATPAQIDTWLSNNVTTLAQARTVLGQLIKVLAIEIQQ